MIEQALIGAAGNVIGGKVLDWLRNQGPELGENEWKEVGVIVGRELRAVYDQNEAGMSDNDDGVQRRAAGAGEIFRQLSYIGEDHGFDNEITDAYRELADRCGEWQSCVLVANRSVYNEHAKAFLDAYENYQQLRS